MKEGCGNMELLSDICIRGIEGKSREDTKLPFVRSFVRSSEVILASKELDSPVGLGFEVEE